MKTFDLQAIDIAVDADRAHRFIADPDRLPEWTEAFASVAGGRAVMRTPAGEVEVALGVEASEQEGTVDWTIVFPDGSSARAYSRVLPLGAGRCVYTFLLTPPPAPLEELEGALEAQSQTLRDELRALRQILEAGEDGREAHEPADGTYG